MELPFIICSILRVDSYPGLIYKLPFNLWLVNVRIVMPLVNSECIAHCILSLFLHPFLDYNTTVIYRASQILCVATDGCCLRPWLAGFPTSGPAYWRCSQTLTIISVQFLSPISSNVSSVRTWRQRSTFLFYGACFFEYLSLSPNYTGIRHRSSWKLYSKFALCFRTRLSAFHIVNIHMFTQWKFQSRHVTNHNNHNHYSSNV